jgi:hypothetical protein
MALSRGIAPEAEHPALLCADPIKETIGGLREWLCRFPIVLIVSVIAA